jgi:hypothetical protein
MIEQGVLKGYFDCRGIETSVLVSLFFKIKDNTSDTVSISKSMKTLILIPKAFAIFISWSGFGLRMPYSYFLIVAELMPES